jgi:hypothetical protein
MYKFLGRFANAGIKVQKLVVDLGHVLSGLESEQLQIGQAVQMVMQTMSQCFILRKLDK